MAIRWVEPLTVKSFWISAASEFLGVFLLVFFDIGITYTAYNTAQNALPHSTRVLLTAVGCSTAVTGIIYILAYCFPHGSAEINPAYTIGFLVRGQLSVLRAAIYCVAQCLGAIVGAIVLDACVTGMRRTNLACTILLDKTEPMQGFAIEFVATFILVFGALALVAGADRNHYGGGVVSIAIGVLVAVIDLAIAPYTGASVNPARSLGPAIVFGDSCWKDHWVYWAGPMLGGLLGGFVTNFFMYDESKDARLPTTVSGSRITSADKRLKTTRRPPVSDQFINCLVSDSDEP